MDQSIVELNEKIDHLTAQVQYLAEQAQTAERERRVRAEMFDDIRPIADDAMAPNNSTR